jgi:hypothetical protein
MITDMTILPPLVVGTVVGTPGSSSSARLFRATPRAIHPADGTSFASQPTGGRQFMSQPAEQTATLRTSRNATAIKQPDPIRARPRRLG